jgi:hypothetical protein
MAMQDSGCIAAARGCAQPRCGDEVCAWLSVSAAVGYGGACCCRVVRRCLVACLVLTVVVIVVDSVAVTISEMDESSLQPAARSPGVTAQHA